jgi:hypothetical protein
MTCAKSMITNNEDAFLILSSMFELEGGSQAGRHAGKESLPNLLGDLSKRKGGLQKEMRGFGKGNWLIELMAMLIIIVIKISHQDAAGSGTTTRTETKR